MIIMGQVVGRAEVRDGVPREAAQAAAREVVREAEAEVREDVPPVEDVPPAVVHRNTRIQRLLRFVRGLQKCGLHRSFDL